MTTAQPTLGVEDDGSRPDDLIVECSECRMAGPLADWRKRGGGCPNPVCSVGLHAYRLAFGRWERDLKVAVASAIKRSSSVNRGALEGQYEHLHPRPLPPSTGLRTTRMSPSY